MYDRKEAAPTRFLDVRETERRLNGGEGGQGRGEDEDNTGCPPHQDQDQDRVRRRIRTLDVLPIRNLGSRSGPGQVLLVTGWGP